VLLLREQHQTEVSAMEDKVNWLELELEKSKKSSNESAEQFQTKSKELELSVRELTAELQVVTDEKQNLLAEFHRNKQTLLR